MSSGGGGGPGSNAIAPPSATGPTGYGTSFPDQSQAQTGALSGAQGIANNSFYPMPQVTSFLFPGGIPGSIAPEGGTPSLHKLLRHARPLPPSGMGFSTRVRASAP